MFSGDFACQDAKWIWTGSHDSCVDWRLGLLGCCGSIDSEGFGGRLDEPAVTQVTFVRHCVDGDALQRDDVLLVVLLFLDDDVAVDQDVVTTWFKRSHHREHSNNDYFINLPTEAYRDERCKYHE